MSLRSWILIFSLIGGIIAPTWVLITYKYPPYVITQPSFNPYKMFFEWLMAIILTLILSIFAGAFAEVGDNANVIGIPFGLASGCALSYFFIIANLVTNGIFYAIINGILIMIIFGFPLIFLCRYLGVKGYELSCKLRRGYIKALYKKAILSGNEVLLQQLFDYELKLQNAFQKRGMKWTPIIDDINRSIATYLITINGSIFISDFAKRFRITEQETRNLLSYSVKLKLIEGYLTRDGKEFITSKKLLEILRRKLE